MKEKGRKNDIKKKQKLKTEEAGGRKRGKMLCKLEREEETGEEGNEERGEAMKMK